MKLTFYVYISALIVLSSAVGISKIKRSLNCESLLSVKVHPVDSQFASCLYILKFSAGKFDFWVKSDFLYLDLKKKKKIRTILQMKKLKCSKYNNLEYNNYI